MFLGAHFCISTVFVLRIRIFVKISADWRFLRKKKIPQIDGFADPYSSPSKTVVKFGCMIKNGNLFDGSPTERYAKSMGISCIS